MKQYNIVDNYDQFLDTDQDEIAESVHSLSLRGLWTEEMLNWVMPFKKNGESYVEMMSKGRKDG